MSDGFLIKENNMMVWQAAYELVNDALGFEGWGPKDVNQVRRLGDLSFELVKFENTGATKTDSWGDTWSIRGILTAVFKVTDDAGNSIYVEKQGHTDSWGYQWDGEFRQVFPQEKSVVVYDYV